MQKSREAGSMRSGATAKDGVTDKECTLKKGNRRKQGGLSFDARDRRPKSLKGGEIQ